jgi:hypothetical protein
MSSKYKHMLPQEVKIWDAFIDRFGLPVGEVSYDVHLGEGAAVDPDWPSWMKTMVRALSTHRVDVAVERPDEVLIIEIKKYAGMSAVGQLVGYEALWLQQEGTTRPVGLVCVCEAAEADMVTVFAFYEIELIVLGELP